MVKGIKHPETYFGAPLAKDIEVEDAYQRDNEYAEVNVCAQPNTFNSAVGYQPVNYKSRLTL